LINQVRRLNVTNVSPLLLEIRMKKRPEDFVECKQIENLQGKPLEESS
jgi:hypothetical protein